MLKPFQTHPGSIQPGAENTDMYALQDFLEMRAGLTEKKRRGLLAQIRHHLDLSGEIQPLPAFMVGVQAVLCITEDAPETYWVYNPTMECLHPWKENSLTPEGV